MATDFPADSTPRKQGSVGVRYFADNNTSIFLSGAKKPERKARYVELAQAAGRYYLLVYKVKKNSTVPYFKIDILSTTTVKTRDLHSEFRFYIDNEDIAVFDVDDSALRKDWVDAINAAIDSLNDRKPSPPRARSGSPQRAISRTLSPGKVRSPSNERNKSPVYAKSSININGDSTTSVAKETLQQPSMSYQPPRSRIALSAPVPAATGAEGHVGTTEPVRRINRHLDPATPLGVSSSPERERTARDAGPDQSLALGSAVKGNLFNALNNVGASPFPAKNDTGSAVSPIAAMSRSERAHHPTSPPQRVSRATLSPGTGIGVGEGTGNPAEGPAQIGGDVLSPPRAPEMRGGTHAASTMRQHTHAVEAASAGPPSQPVQMQLEGEADAAVSSEDEKQDALPSTAKLSQAVLLQENQALAAMNEELNEALERTESLLRASEEDHLYQLSHLHSQLERAQAEPAQLKAEIAELQEERDSLAQSFADQSHELELKRAEIRDLKEEVAASQRVILGLQDTLTEYETKYSARNVDRIAQLETALNATHAVLAERDAEVEELHNQLEAFRAIIREKERELRNDPLQAKSAELSSKRAEMQREIDELRQALDRKDQEFVSGLSGALENQIKAKMVPLSQTTKKLTMDLAAAEAAEEAQRVSKVRLESLVAQQEGYIEQLNRQIEGLRAELARSADLAQELAMYKDDARSAAAQRELALKERDDLSRRVLQLEREITAQKDAFLTQLESAQAEIFKQKAHVSKVGIEESHLQSEISILHRRIELGKEQYLQLEAQLHEAQRQLAIEGQHSAKKKDAFQETLEAANQTIRDLQNQCKSLEDMLTAEQLDAKRRQQEHDEAAAALKRAQKEALARSSALEEKVHKLELSLTSERVASTHLRETNEDLQIKLQGLTDKLADANEELESSTARNQRQIADLRQQLKDSETQRRLLTEREGSSQRELVSTLKAAEDANRMLREEMANIAQERQNESKAMADRLSAQLNLQEKLERKNQELERLLSSSESEKRIADQHYAKREAELITTITELTTEKDALEVFVHKEKGEVMRSARALEEAQQELRSKTQFHEKLTKLHNEQVQVSAALSEEIQQLKRAHAEAVQQHGVEVDQLQLKIRSLQAAQTESTETAQARCRSLEDSLISTSQELKRTTQQLEEARAQLQDAQQTQARSTAALAEAHKETQSLAEKLAAQAKETGALTQRIAELVQTTTAQRDTIAELTAQVTDWEVADTARSKELSATKARLQDAEDQLRDLLRKLEAAENEIHYLQDIAIPDLNNSAMDTTERMKSEQNRYTAEIEALQRSIEQREKAAKELHARIHQLESIEASLNQTNASLALKMGEMIPIKEHNARLEAQRQATAAEIAELAASKHAALSERDEAMNRVTAMVQDCRREAYALRRVASNIAIHAETEVGKKDMSRGGFSASFTGKPVTDIFASAEETGTELREMVQLVSTCSESMLRDFVALRTSSVHQWHTLHAELQRVQAAVDGHSPGGVTAAVGSPQRSPLSPMHKAGSPFHVGGEVAHTIPTASLTELLQQTESMLDKLVAREKAAVSKLTRQVEEEQARCAQAQAKNADLQQRIESLNEQLVTAQSSKHSADQRCTAEVQALQQRIHQLTADLNKRQDEYSEMIAGLTKSHEEQSARQAAHLAAVMEQRIAEANQKARSRVEEVEQRLRGSESALHNELDELKRDYQRQVELCQRLERDYKQRDSEAVAALARFDAVQAELEDKTYQLENTLGQLERAELKAAKEARQRLELERTLRRFKNPGGGSGVGATPSSMGSFVDDVRDGVADSGSIRVRPASAIGLTSRQASTRSVTGGPPSGPVAMASQHTSRDRNLDLSYDNASINTASVQAAEEFDEARDLPSPNQRTSNSTPLLRAAMMRGTTPESRDATKRFFASGTNTANSSVVSMRNAVEAPARSASVRSITAGSVTGSHRAAAPEVQEMGERVHVPSSSSTIRSSAYSSPDNSPEPASTSGSVRNLNRSLESAVGEGGGNSAFNRAFLATSRIEQAMKAKGWKLNK